MDFLSPFEGLAVFPEGEEEVEEEVGEEGVFGAETAAVVAEGEEEVGEVGGGDAL